MKAVLLLSSPRILRLVGAGAVVVLGLFVGRMVRARHEARLTDLAVAVMRSSHPEWSAAPTGPLVIDVRIGGASAVVHLDNIVRAADGDEARFRELVALSVKNLSDTAADARVESFDSVRGRMRAVLVSASFATEQGVAQRPFAGDVVETFALDSPTRMTYVRKDQPAEWHVSVEELHDAGTHALWQLVQREPLEPASRTAVPGKLIALTPGDNYAAARLLIPELREALANVLGSPFFVAVPNRDELLACSADYPTAELAARAAADFSRGPYSISGRIFRADRAGIVALPMK